MCDHKWVPFKIMPAHSASINTMTFNMRDVSFYQVTEVICAECGEVKAVAEHPDNKAQKMMDEYQIQTLTK